MQISQQGLDLIKKWEGFRSEAYLCPASVITLGFGSTRINGRPVRMGEVCTREQAEEWLKKDVQYFESVVNESVNVPLTQSQFDALVSFTYNIGASAFRDSTLLRKLNAADYVGAAAEFLRWDKAAGKSVEGLRNRRKDEKQTFELGGLVKVSESMKMPATDQLDYLMDGHASLPIAELPKAAAKQLQELLNCVGYSLTVDGIIGPASMKAFESWKVSADQNQPDAIGKGSLGLLKEEAKDRVEGKEPTDEPVTTLNQKRDRGRLFRIPGISKELGEFDPIYEGSNFKFYEAFKGTSRLSDSKEVTENVVRLARYMDEVRAYLGNKPIVITSWYRPPHVNRAVGGVANSAHLSGMACDFYVLGMSITETFDRLKRFNTKHSIGVAGSFLHIDLRSGGPRRWRYNSTAPNISLW